MLLEFEAEAEVMSSVSPFLISVFAAIRGLGLGSGLAFLLFFFFSSDFSLIFFFLGFIFCLKVEQIIFFIFYLRVFLILFKGVPIFFFFKVNK